MRTPLPSMASWTKRQKDKASSEHVEFSQISAEVAADGGVLPLQPRVHGLWGVHKQAVWKLWVPERQVGQQRDVCVSFMSTGGRPGRTRGQEHFVEVFGAFTRRMNCRARFSAISFSRLMIKAQARKKRKRDSAKALLPFSEKDSGSSSLTLAEMSIHLCLVFVAF